MYNYPAFEILDRIATARRASEAKAIATAKHNHDIAELNRMFPVRDAHATRPPIPAGYVKIDVNAPWGSSKAV